MFRRLSLLLALVLAFSGIHNVAWADPGDTPSPATPSSTTTTATPSETPSTSPEPTATTGPAAATPSAAPTPASGPSTPAASTSPSVTPSAQTAQKPTVQGRAVVPASSDPNEPFWTTEPMLDWFACSQKVDAWMYPNGTTGHGVYAFMFVGLTHNADNWDTLATGTCYAGLWYDMPDFVGYVGGVGLDPSTAAVPAADPPAPYGKWAQDLCTSIYGPSAWVMHSESIIAICSDADLGPTAAPQCSDLGIDDPDSLPAATQQEMMSLPRAAFTLCIEQSDNDSGGGISIGRPSTSSSSSWFSDDRPGNLPYSSCSAYAASADKVPGWVSLDRRTACRAGWIWTFGLVWSQGGYYEKVGTAHFDDVQSVTIDPSSRFGFTATVTTTTVDDSLELTTSGTSFTGCGPCDNVVANDTTTGTDLSGTATFSAAAPGAADSYTVNEGDASFSATYDWDPFPGLNSHHVQTFKLPEWRCTSNGYVNPTINDNGAMYMGPSGCVFPWAAGLMTYSQTETEKLTLHIFQAQQSGLPGAIGSGTYLHYLANQTIKDLNRATACPDSLSNPMAGDGYTCDEYPFASTYEGAGSGSGGSARSFDGCYMSDPQQTGADGFSRCFVPGEEQGVQAGIISSTIASQQLVDGDPYQVKIVA